MILHLLWIALAVILFYIVNWIGAQSKPLDFGYVQMSVALQDDTAPLFNYLFKVLAPIVYIILLAVLFQATGWKDLCDNLYLIVVYYWAFRFIYITVRGQLPLLNWKVQVLYWVSSISLAVWVNSIIDKVESILPSPEALLEELWILIILFLYSIFNKLEFSREGADRRIKRYTYKKVDYFQKRFGAIIDSNFSVDFFKACVYSIMVYEDFNRPALARFIERLFSHFTSSSHTYGIMQVKSSKSLSDEESVELACKKIKKDVLEILPEYYCGEDDSVYLYGLAYGVFKKYNPGDPKYSEQVVQVYKNIILKYYKDISNCYTRVDMEADLA